MAQKFDIYEAVTQRIIDELEKGLIPWEKPWFGSPDGAISGATGKPYSFTNQLLLLKAGEWFTWNQIQKLGAKVRKSERSSMVTFWKQVLVTTEKPDGTKDEKYIPCLRYYLVWHESQIEGLPEKADRPSIAHVDPCEEAEAIVSGYTSKYGVAINREDVSERAYYRPSTDSITVPAMGQFSKQSEYYSTLFHEMVHSTGHKSRLDRLDKVAHFGSEEYSKEELVAEIGAAALTNHVGIENRSSFRNSAAYIQGWLSALKDDKKLLVSATGKAEKAVNMILGSVEA